MKSILGVLAFLTLGSVAIQASNPHELEAWSRPNYRHLEHRRSRIAPSWSTNNRRQNSGRCKKLQVINAAVNQTSVSPSPSPSSSSDSSPSPSPNFNKPTVVASSQAPGPSVGVSGLVNVVSSACGGTGATQEVTATSGPNGNINWLNCGINGSGWNPPYLTVKDIVSVNLTTAIQDPNTPFTPCVPYVPLFESYGNQFNIPPILLASFAMQESSCNPNTVGGAGEQGLMQLTPDKCTNAPGGNCQDPDFNIQTGTALFANTLATNGGSLLLAIGGFNGWSPNMTYAEATAEANTTCCRCQQNLDYLMQYLNGWALNINAYTNVPRLGEYFNLDQCQ